MKRSNARSFPVFFQHEQRVRLCVKQRGATDRDASLHSQPQGRGECLLGTHQPVFVGHEPCMRLRVKQVGAIECDVHLTPNHTGKMTSP